VLAALLSAGAARSAPPPSTGTAPATVPVSTAAPATVPVSTAPLVTVPVSTPAPATPAAPRPPVLAYYYAWFEPSSWRRAKTDLPVLGRYSSDDREVVTQHVRWAKAAGIDGFIVSWKHTPTLDRRLALLSRVADAEQFKLVVIYQGLDFHRDPQPAARVAEDLAYFASDFAPLPAFRLFARPTVIWSGSWKFSRSDIALAAGPVRDRVAVLGSERNVRDYEAKADLFDGDAYYWSSVNPDTYRGYPDKLRAMGDAVHARGGTWIAPAAPGFDARLIGGTTVVHREGSRTLDRQIDAALGSRPDALGIISWNEFSEASYIEPSRRYGYAALEAVARRFANGAKVERADGGSFASGDPRASLGAGADSADSSSPGGESNWGLGVLAGLGGFLLVVTGVAFRRTRADGGSSGGSAGGTSRRHASQLARRERIRRRLEALDAAGATARPVGRNGHRGDQKS